VHCNSFLARQRALCVWVLCFLRSAKRADDRLGRDPAMRFEQLIRLNAVDCNGGYLPLKALPRPLKVR